MDTHFQKIVKGTSNNIDYIDGGGDLAKPEGDNLTHGDAAVV